MGRGLCQHYQFLNNDINVMTAKITRLMQGTIATAVADKGRHMKRHRIMLEPVEE